MIAKRNTRKRVVNKAIVRGFRAIPTSEASLHLNSELSAPSRSRTQRPHLPHHRLRPPETNPPTTSKTSICTCTTEAPRPHHTWSTQSILSGTKSPWSCTKRGSSCVNLEGFGGYADATGCGVFRRRGSRGDAGRDVFVGTERYTHTRTHTLSIVLDPRVSVVMDRAFQHTTHSLASSLPFNSLHFDSLRPIPYLATHRPPPHLPFFAAAA
jgi:hypothetical protein